jgi:hypothetical protein
MTNFLLFLHQLPQISASQVLVFLQVYVVTSVATTYALYVFYSAIMNVKRVRDLGRLTAFGAALGYPTLAIGLLLDLYVNVFVMSIVLFELPREWTVTSRLRRHHLKSKGWRLAVVKFFEPVLDPLDPSGDHV